MDAAPGALEVVWSVRWALLDGARVTVQLALAVILISTVLGLVFGLVLAYLPLILRWPVRLFVDVVRGIPVLVLILFTFYGLAILKLKIAPFTAGVVALSAFAAAHVAETLRGAVQSIPVGQTEAAKAIGLTFAQRLLWVILPQAIRRALPPWINTTAEIVKGTTLVSIIGVVELLLATQQAVARTYMPLELYGTAFVIYFVVCFAIAQVGAALERRSAHLRY